MTTHIIMQARFKGQCKKCKKWFQEGNEIIWGKGDGAYHPICAKDLSIKYITQAQSRAEWLASRDANKPDPPREPFRRATQESDTEGDNPVYDRDTDDLPDWSK